MSEEMSELESGEELLDFGDNPSFDLGEIDSPSDEDENLQIHGDDGELDEEFLEEDEDVQLDEEEEKRSIIDRLSDMIFGKKEDEVEEGETWEEDIDDDFTEAARASGWNDDDIVEFAGNYSNDELRNLIPSLLDEEKEDNNEEIKEDNSLKLNKEDVNDEALKPVIDNIVSQLEAKYQEKIQSLEERFNAVEKEKSQRESVRLSNQADEFFDKLSNDYPVFGKTEDLPRFPAGSPKAGQYVPSGEAFNARSAVVGTAVKFAQLGMDWDNALQEAFDWYKGKNLEEQVRSKVLKELKKNEKRISPKRSEHSAARKFTNEADQKGALISEIAQRSGID